MKVKLTIELDETIAEHLRSESCDAGDFQPCGFSERIVNEVWYAANGPADELDDTEKAEAALIDAAESKWEASEGR